MARKWKTFHFAGAQKTKSEHKKWRNDWKRHENQLIYGNYLFECVCIFLCFSIRVKLVITYSHESALSPISTAYSFIHGNSLLVTNNSICFQCNRFLGINKIYHGFFFIDFFVLFKYYVFFV